MRDAIVIAIVVGFFILAAGYVAWCERIVANDATRPAATDRIDAKASPDHAVTESALSGSRP